MKFNDFIEVIKILNDESKKSSTEPSGYDILAEQIEKRYKNYLTGNDEHPYIDDLVVYFDFKYDWETEYYSEVVILTSDGVWNVDWCEGQTDVKLIWAIAVGDLPDYIKEDE